MKTLFTISSIIAVAGLILMFSAAAGLEGTMTIARTIMIAALGGCLATIGVVGILLTDEENPKEAALRVANAKKKRRF